MLRRLIPITKGASASTLQPARRRALAVVFAAHATLFASWAAHIPEIQSSLHLNFTVLGIAMLGTPLGAVAGMVFAGRSMYRYDTAWFLRFSLVGYCLAAPLVGLARSPGELFVALALWGAGQGIVDVAMNAYGADLQRRSGSPALPGLHGQWSLGALVGAAIGFAAVSMHVTLTMQQIVLAVVVLCLAGGATIGLPSLDRAPGRPTTIRGPQHRQQTRLLLALGFLAFASSLCEGIVNGWSAVYLDYIGGRPAVVGLGFLGFSAGMAIVRLRGDRLLARRAPRSVIPILAALGAVATAVGLMAGTPAAATVGFVVLGMGIGLVVPTAIGQAAQLGGARPGASIALIGAISWTGFVLAPPAVGLMSSMTSVTAALTALPLLAMAIAVISRRRSLVGALESPSPVPNSRCDGVGDDCSRRYPAEANGVCSQSMVA